MQFADYRELDRLAHTHLINKAKKEKEKKRIELLKSDDDRIRLHMLPIMGGECSDLFWNGYSVALFVCLFLCVPALLGLAFSGLWWVTLLLVTPLALTATLNKVFRDRKVKRILREEFDFKLPSFDELKPAKYVNTYLTDEIERLREDLLGKTSQLSRIKGRLARTDKQVRTVRVQLERRCDGEDTPEYLIEAHERIQDTCQRIATKRETLDEYTARIEAFLRECQDQVKRVQQPLSDLELVHETNRLCEETEQLETQAAATVARTTSQLASRMLETKNRLYRQFESAGVNLALASAETGDALKDFQLLESTIGKFVPAEQVLEAEDEETSVAG